MKVHSTVLQAAQKTENTEEEVDKIEVEANCSHDVLIGGEASVDEVSIIDDIPTEQQSASNGVNEIESRAERDEHANKAGHYCHIFRSGIQRTNDITYSMRQGHRIAMVPFQKSHTTDEGH